jgi:ribosomal protein L7/L12
MSMFSLTLLIGGLLLILVIGGMMAVFLLNRSWGGSLDRSPRLDAGAPAVRAEPMLTGDLQADALTLLAAGRKIEAVKRVRELTGLGLKEAKDYVDALQQGLAVETPALRGAGAWEGAAAPQELEAELRALVANGRKLEAIKLLRERSGIGLKEAKDFVDTLG